MRNRKHGSISIGTTDKGWFRFGNGHWHTGKEGVFIRSSFLFIIWIIQAFVVGPVIIPAGMLIALIAEKRYWISMYI